MPDSDDAPDLYDRLDAFANEILDAAKAEVDLSKKLAAFKEVRAYLEKRDPAQPIGKPEKPVAAKDERPTILRLQDQVNRRRR